jgi:TonB family protein
MRSTTLALIAILFPPLGAAATFEARSEHYLLSVDHTAVSTKVVVTDLDANSPVISEDVPCIPGQPSTMIDRTIGDLHFTLRVMRTAALIHARLEVDRGDMQIDAIGSDWSLGPRRRTGAVGGYVVGSVNGAYRVGGDVHPPKVVHRVEPIYPESARKNQVSGAVVVQLSIDANGHVTEAMPLQGPPDLLQAATDAVKQWTWEPGTRAGKPVPVIFNVVVDFKLNTPVPPY